ncbi:MAG: hypothetical protein IJX30_02775 [Clostridia bacterium]|nr:hypothetical protein [Clostridia bacterium]
MRKSNGKVFLYELKKTFLIPTIWAVFSLLLNVIDLLFFSDPEAGPNDYDDWAKAFLYIFYAIVMVLFIYRMFTTRKLYEKVGVRAGTLFWVRILYIFGYCFLFTTLLTLMGTLNLAVFKIEQYVEAQEVIKTALFAYQGKSAWYFLFGAAVGMTGAITYATVVFVQNLIISKERWYLKIVWGIAFVAAICLAHFVIADTYMFPALGGNEYFTTPIPYGAGTYRSYKRYFFRAEVYDPSLALRLEPEILRCDLCWNITNVWALLVGLFIIVFAFLSIGFLHREKNEGYESTQKEESK